MVISFYGENCFKLQSGDLVALTDPIESSTGLTPARFKYDIAIKTISSFPPLLEADSKEALNIVGPGEYNIKGINISGYPLENEASDKFIKTAYVATIEDIKFCFLGHISETPSHAAMEHLENIDILFIPAGGNPFLDQKKAVKLVRQIQPKIVVPAFYKIPGLKRKADDLKVFLEEFGGQKPAPQEKLVIKKKDIASIKSTQVAVLKI